MGGLIACDWRALLDRAIAEGKLVLPPAEKAALTAGSPYTAFGTVSHFHLQSQAGCAFDGPLADYAPTPDEEKQAAELYGNDVVLMREMADRVAKLGIVKLPKAPDGKPWRAEIPFGKEEGSGLPFSGTLDFLSQDMTEIGDLKTTSKPLLGGRAKQAHVIQLVCYAWLVEQCTGVRPTKGWLLYVSSRAAWVHEPVRVNFDDLAEYREQIVKQARYFTSPHLWDIAMPRILDDRCGDLYCPHTSRCRDAIRVKPIASATTGAMIHATTKNIFGGSRATK